MLNILFILMLTINPATQSDSLFIASDSLFENNGIKNLGIINGWCFHPGERMSGERIGTVFFIELPINKN